MTFTASEIEKRSPPIPLTLNRLAAIATWMRNLYSLNPKEDDVGCYFRVSHNRRAAFKPVNAIFPRHTAPVVRQSRSRTPLWRASSAGCATSA